MPLCLSCPVDLSLADCGFQCAGLDCSETQSDGLAYSLEHSAEYAPCNLKVIAKGVPDKIHRIVMAGFEVYVVNFIPTRSVDDAADARPQTSHGAHSTRPKRA
jgi:hypothetical protein